MVRVTKSDNDNNKFTWKNLIIFSPHYYDVSVCLSCLAECVLRRPFIPNQCENHYFTGLGQNNYFLIRAIWGPTGKGFCSLNLSSAHVPKKV